MDLRMWMPWYRRIAEAMGYSEEEDQEAANILSRLLALSGMGPWELKARVSGRPAVVFGAGPSLPLDVERLADAGLLEGCAVISADGATAALLERGILPDVVVTDLDGDPSSILRADSEGSLLLVHAHGDNVDRLLELVPRLEGYVIGTTQVEPRPRVYNFGGFTDGDRCAFAAEEAGARAIILAGMDLGEVVGRYSKPHLRADEAASEVKAAKLRFAKELLEWLATWSRARLFNATYGGCDIRGFERVRDLGKLREAVGI